MYIRELQLDGFGALHNVSLSLEAPVTIVFGANEAGKSTLLRFIRSMLYGFPTRKDPVERGEPVFGGRHGGRLAIVTADSRELLLERYAEGGASAGAGSRKTAGGLTIRDSSGVELGWSQSEWERHALGGVSERLFRQLFAVSLDELHELLTMQGEEIGNYLYHAGLAGGASLSDARRKLASEMDKLYRPKGSNQEINRLLASIKELEAEIRQSRSGITLFQEAKLELLQTQNRLDGLDKAIPAMAAEATRFQAALELREWWLKREMLRNEELEMSHRLPDPASLPFPEEAAAEWQGYLRSRQTAAERLEEAVQAVSGRQAKLEDLQWDEILITRAAELEKLEAMREAAAARQEEKESVVSELHLLDESLEMLRIRLSPGWEDDDLHNFSSVTSEREPLRRLQQAWGEAERARERLDADAGRLHRQREVLRSEMIMAESTGHTARSAGEAKPDTPFGRFRPQTRDLLLQAWNDLEDELRRLERSAVMAKAERGLIYDSGSRRYQRIFGMRTAWFALSGVLGLSAAALYLIALFTTSGGKISSSSTAITLILAALALSAGWVAMRRNHRPSETSPAAGSPHDLLLDGRRRAEERLGALLDRPGTAAAALLQESSVQSDETRKELREAVQDRLTELDRIRNESTRMEEYKRRMAELDREKGALDAEIHRAESRMDELQTEWTVWLRERRLPLNLTPDSLPELINLAEQAQTALRRHARAHERIQALEQIQSAFRETAAALFAVCPPPASMESDPALAVAWLYRRSAEQTAIREEAMRTARSLQEAEAAREAMRQAYQEAEAEIGRILESAEAADEAAYEHRLRVDGRRRSIARERREIELRLHAGRTPEAAAELDLLFESHDEAALTELHREAALVWQSADHEKTALLDKRGRLAQELERLQKEAETEDRLTRLSELESRLERFTERYAIFAIADRLLQETKAVFEEERQPEVLRLASRYFAGMTGGAYARITAPGDSPAIFAETRDRRVTDSSFLSRGTQEQLYLSMRFALAEAASRDVPLPLLLDDLFVHFDERRLRQTVPVLQEISQTRQVILFTCHRHVADAIGQGMPTAKIIVWERPGEGARSAERGPGRSETANRD